VFFYYPLTASTDNVEAIDLFSLQSLAGPYDQSPVKSRLLCEGRDTGIAIQGLGLDFQFQTPGFYVLFANWSCPFEESIEITLLDRNLERVAHRSISRDYGSIYLESVEVLGSGRLRLCCADGQDYQLNLPTSRLPLTIRSGVTSRLGKKILASWFKVKKL